MPIKGSLSALIIYQFELCVCEFIIRYTAIVVQCVFLLIYSNQLAGMLVTFFTSPQRWSFNLGYASGNNDSVPCRLLLILFSMQSCAVLSQAIQNKWAVRLKLPVMSF